MQAVAFEPPRSYLQWISNPSLNYSSKLAIAYEPWHSKAFMSTKFNNPDKSMNFTETHAVAAIAQLGERQTEDLKVPGSIPGLGISYFCIQAPRSASRERRLVWHITMRHTGRALAFCAATRRAPTGTLQ